MLDTPTPILLRLAERLSHPVSEAARARARRHLLDWLGCAMAGRRDGLSLSLATIAPLQAAHHHPGPAFDRAHANAIQALLMHAVEGSALESDDVERRALLHPAAVVVPAALAASSPSTAIGDVLVSLVRGYEAMIRIGRALGASHYRFWHTSSTAGAFGAAAATASLLGLSAEATAHALATAGSRTGGLWQMRHEPVPTKRLHFAWAALEGFLAAHWAAQGLRGPLSLLEGAQGLFAATAPGADPEAVLAEAADWLIFEVSFKPYPACRHAHPAIDALADLFPLPVAAIEAIHVETYQAAVAFCDRVHPRDEGEARFSIQHALAARLLLGKPALDHYREPWLGDPRLRAMRERIRVSEAGAFSARFPAHFGARVEVTLQDGAVLAADRQDASGDPEHPLAEAELQDKALSLMAEGGIPPSEGRALSDFLLKAPEAQPISPLLAAIASP